MTYLAAAVVLIGLISILNILMTFGVVRRLRTYSALIGELGSVTGPAADLIAPVGQTVGGFTVTSTDGELISREGLTGHTLVAFFAQDCAPCQEEAPAFVEQAAALPGGRDQVLAVVVGDVHTAGEFAALLAPVARVVIEPDNGWLATAFAVSGFPAACVVDESGVVIATARDLKRLSRLVPA